ncbi:Flp pilus assembly pilin Flp [Actinomadura coerulea]|uniref:Flp pilus assembly pilin Flp n=1 Tax=Actinomadura coerulea TaxID=46159 RepID=A0A7X0G5W7_9ACTN|nr:hypothetical protein [Actinomadura coerulea]MBB6399779.1 Flp pilus assembly pilin Flp [Actinomadura coerulea]GGQ15898.1 hypothetical protein GCM10010187_35130 [Actinomadura coerulea]
MNPILPLYVHTDTFVRNRADDVQDFVRTRIERIRDAEDRGASAIEYAGLVLIAGIIVVFLIGAAKNTILPKITDAINQMFGGGEGGDPKKK